MISKFARLGAIHKCKLNASIMWLRFLLYPRVFCRYPRLVVIATSSHEMNFPVAPKSQSQPQVSWLLRCRIWWYPPEDQVEGYRSRRLGRCRTCR